MEVKGFQSCHELLNRIRFPVLLYTYKSSSAWGVGPWFFLHSGKKTNTCNPYKVSSRRRMTPLWISCVFKCSKHANIQYLCMQACRFGVYCIWKLRKKVDSLKKKSKNNKEKLNKIIAKLYIYNFFYFAKSFVWIIMDLFSNPKRLFTG